MNGADEFRWMFAAEYPAVVRTVFLVLHNYPRSEEIAQDAFVQLLRYWEKVSRYEAPDAWVRRVAIRLAVKDANRERRRAVLTLRHAQTDLVESSDDAPMDAALIAAIRRLPPQQRSVVVLFYLEDRPMDEIAEILGCSASTGWVHLHRARSAGTSPTTGSVSSGCPRRTSASSAGRHARPTSGSSTPPLRSSA